MEQNQLTRESQKEALMNQKVKELEIDLDYLKQMTGLGLTGIELRFKHDFAEELFNENRISEKLKEELLSEIKVKAEELKIKQSDLAKEAIANGAGRREFLKYILD